MNFKSLFCFFVLCLIQSNLLAQNALFTSLDSLENSLKYYYNASWTSERVEYLEGEKDKFLNYLPSLGFQFGFPSVSFSTDKIVKMRRDKREKLAKLKSIDMKWNVLFNEELLKLNLMYKKLEVEKRKIELIEKSFETENKIFEIWKEGFDKKEIAPLEFLKIEKDYEAKKENIEIKKMEFEIRILEIYEVARFGMKQKELAYFDNK